MGRRSLAARLGPPALLLALVALVSSGLVPWPCPFRVALHLPCPGCGMTRATRLLLSGDLHGALQMHPLVLVLAPWSALLLAGELVGHARAGSFSQTMQSRFFRVGSYLVFGLAIAVWAARFAGAFGGAAPE